MNLDFSIWSIISAGFLSFLSPCVLPLVLPYLCYMSGVKLEDLNYKQAENNMRIRLRVFVSALCFIFGFSTIFISLGVSASSIGIFLNKYRSIFSFIAGIIIILMGLNFLGIFRLAIFNKEIRFQKKESKASFLGSYFMGLAFAFGWTPCIGPMLGLILTIASSKNTVADGAWLLFLYSVGLAIPFLLAALFSDIFLSFFKKFRSYLGIMEKFIGLFLIITGLLFITGQMEIISRSLLVMFPALSQL